MSRPEILSIDVTGVGSEEFRAGTVGYYLLEMIEEQSLAIKATRDLHQPKKVWESDRSYTLICRSCELQAWPCRTTQALDTHPMVSECDRG